MRSFTEGLGKSKAVRGQAGCLPKTHLRQVSKAARGQEKFPLSPRHSYQVTFLCSRLNGIILSRQPGNGKTNLSVSHSPFLYLLLGVSNILNRNLILMLSPDTSLSPLACGVNVRPEIVVIGTSLGGLHALEVLLAGLPKSLPVPVAIAQHRHKTADDSLCVFLQHQCALPVKEAEDKEELLPGWVYLAPADYHLLVEAGYSQADWNSRDGAGIPSLALSTEAPVLHARPSIDVLFESAADTFREKVIGVILTGASHDGSQGLLKIKANRGIAIVQDPTTALSPTMPKAAISTLQKHFAKAAKAVDWILPLHEIAPLLVNLCHPALR